MFAISREISPFFGGYHSAMGPMTLMLPFTAHSWWLIGEVKEQENLPFGYFRAGFLAKTANFTLQ
jgi:hypothetical protein